MDNTQLAINSFNLIRDIPYSLNIPERDASCGSKAKLLGEILNRLGYQTRIMTCNFDWLKLPIPISLAQLAKDEFKIGKHYFLSVNSKSTNNTWMYLDPTWDRGLEAVFSISQWDGQSNTTLAVPARDIETYENNGTIKSINDFPFKDKSQSKFSYQFNQWLNTIRK